MIKRATAEDLRWIMGLRNMPQTYANCVRDRELTYDEFQQTIQPDIFIVHRIENVGYIRFDHKEATEIGIAIHPDYWGRGFATDTVREGVYKMAYLGYRTFIAKVKRGNESSCRVFLKNGFRLRFEDAKYLDFYKGV